ALLIVAGTAAGAFRLRPRQWYKVESTQPAIYFHTRRREVLPALLERLDVIREAEQQPVPPPEPPGTGVTA
ncbi:MAG TPA: hypothetical protein VFU47_02310, partial [Armatimonadota bacterium]|nr:hypothetical protein [Armatimonadota bacterium]